MSKVMIGLTCITVGLLSSVLTIRYMNKSKYRKGELFYGRV